MIRNLKALGLALVAVCALGATVASSASAYEGKITSTGPFTLVGHETTPGATRFTAFGGEVKCPESTVTGHKTLTTAETSTKKHELLPSGSTSATLTLDLKQEKCVAVEGGATHKATVTLNGCDFDLTITETLVANSSYAVDAGVVCPAGKVIEIEIYPFAGSELGGVVCTIKVKEQSGLKGGTLSAGGGGSLNAGGTFTGIHSERSGGGCAAETTTVAEFHVGANLVGKTAAGVTTALSLSHP